MTWMKSYSPFMFLLAQYSMYGSVSIPAKSIDITTNKCDFPSTFHVNEEVKCETKFKMPLGTMEFQGHCIGKFI
jgi:hypothetical protein